MVAWTAGGIFDAILLGISASELSANDAWGSSLVGLQGGRIVLFFFTAIWCYAVLKKDVKAEKATDEETRSLLGATADDGNSASSTAYGSVPEANGDGDGSDTEGEDDEDDKEIKALQQKRLEESGGWLGYLKTLMVFMPFILPYSHRPTQLWIVVLGITIVLQRFLVVLIPTQYGILTEAIGEMAGTGTF